MSVDEDVAAIRWNLSAFRVQSSASKRAPEVPLFVLGRVRLVRCGKVIRFRLGSWLELAVGSGATQ